MRSIHELCTVSLVLALNWSVSGCSPVKGYAGPELPPEQVATIYLEYESDEIEISRATSNGVEFSWQGITLLPSDTAVEVSGAAKGEPRNCERCYKVDEYGYQRCLDEYYSRDNDKKKRTECRWDDFTEIRELCDQDLYDATCQISFRTTAGGQYNVRVNRSGTGASLTAVQRGVPEPLGYGQCSTYRERVGQTDSYVGSGRYTSTYGARPCNSW